MRREQLTTRHDVEPSRGDMRAGFAELRGEFAELRGETRGAIADLRAEMHEQLGAVHALIAVQTLQLGVWMLGAMTTLTALAFGAASLR